MLQSDSGYESSFCAEKRTKKLSSSLNDHSVPSVSESPDNIAIEPKSKYPKISDKNAPHAVSVAIFPAPFPAESLRAW